MLCFLLLRFILCSATFSGLWDTPNTAFYTGYQAEYSERLLFQIGNRTLEYSLQVQDVVGNENISALYSFTLPLTCAYNWCETAWERGFDAAWRWRSKTYFFLNEYYSRPNPEGEFGNPNTISGGWKGFPTFLDAAAEADTTSSDWGFQGDQAWLYSLPGDKTILKAGMDTQFPGIPSNVSSATRHFHTGYMLFFKNEDYPVYWAFDPVNNRILPNYPRNMTENPATCQPHQDVSSFIGFVSDKSGSGAYLPNSHCQWRVFVPQLYYRGINGEWDDLLQLESSSSNFQGVELRFSRFNLTAGDTVQIWANNDIAAPINDPYGTSNATLLWTFNSTYPPPTQTLFISNTSKSFRVQFDTTGDPGKGDGFHLDYWLKNSAPSETFRSLIGPIWLTSYRNSTPVTVVVQPKTQTTSIIDFRIYMHTLFLPVDDPVKRGQVFLAVYDGITATGSNLVANCSGTLNSAYSCPANVNRDRCACLATTVSGFATLVLSAPADVFAAANARYTVRSTCTGYQSFTDKSGTISDGSGDLLYFPNQFCQWYVNNTFDPDALIVALTFQSFSIQDIANVAIYASSTNTTSPIAEFQGTRSTPFEVIAEAAQMLVIFNSYAVTSGAVGQLPGFEANYNVIYAPDRRYTTVSGFEAVMGATPNTSRYDIVCDVGTQLNVVLNVKDKFQRIIDAKYSPNWYRLFLRAIPTSLEPFNASILSVGKMVNISSSSAAADAAAMGISLAQYATILDYPAVGNVIPMSLPTTPSTYIFYLVMTIQRKNITQRFLIAEMSESLRVQLVAGAPVASASSLAICASPQNAVNGSALTGIAGEEQAFCISVRDKFRNILGRGRSDVRVFVISASYAIPVRSSDYQNGSYLATSLPYTAASYSMTVLVGGSDIPGSPFGYFVEPGPTAPNKTTVIIGGVTVVDLGKVKFANLNLSPQTPFNVTVRTFDEQNNFRNSLVDIVNLSVTGMDHQDFTVTPLQYNPPVRPRPAPPSDDIEGVQGAAYIFTVVVFSPGNFDLQLKVNSQPILSEVGEPAAISLVVGFTEELRASWHRILAILAIIFNCMICIASAILVWLRRKKVPLKPLSPTLLLLNTFGCLTFIHYALVEIFDTSYPCLLYFRGSLVAPILWMNPLLLSIYRLRLVFPYSALKRKWAKISLDANALANIQTKRMSFSENRFLLYYFITTVPPVAVILILGAVIGRESGTGCTMDTALEATWAAVGALYFILFLAAIYSVRDFDERLGFRQEVAFCGMYASTIALVAVVIRFSQSVSPGTKDDIMLLVSLVPLAYQIRGVLVPALRTITLFMKAPNSEIELPLTEILVTKNGFEFFCGFCCMEFSQENPLCWEAIENFRKKTSVSALKDIYHKFFLPESPLQVNFPADIIRDVGETISKTTEQTQITLIQGAFDNAQSEVISLMTNDSYRRFLASDHYKAFRNGEKPPSRDAFTTRSDTHPESAEQIELTRVPERKQRISAVGLFDTTETETSRPESKTGSTYRDRPRDESRIEEDDQPTKIISDLPPLISELSQDQEAYVI